MAQTMRHLAVLTDLVPLKWHDLARHIAGHCGNKICASVKPCLSACAFGLILWIYISRRDVVFGSCQNQYRRDPSVIPI